MIIGTSTAFGEQAGDVARAAVLWAQWPDTVPGGTVSRLCCSGFDAIGSAAARIGSGMNEVVVAGGVESMSRVPMLADAPAFASDGDYRDRTGYVTIGVSADLTAAGQASPARSWTPLPSSLIVGRAPPPSSSVIPVSVGARPSCRAMRVGGPMRPSRGSPRCPHSSATTRRGRACSKGCLTRSVRRAACTPWRRLPSWLTVRRRSSWDPPQRRSTWPAARPPRGYPVGCPLAAPDRDGNRGADSAAAQRLTPADLAVVEANESFAVSPLLLTRELGLDPAIVNPHGGSVATGHPREPAAECC